MNPGARTLSPLCEGLDPAAPFDAAEDLRCRDDLPRAVREALDGHDVRFTASSVLGRLIVVECGLGGRPYAGFGAAAVAQVLRELASVRAAA